MAAELGSSAALVISSLTCGLHLLPQVRGSDERGPATPIACIGGLGHPLTENRDHRPLTYQRIVLVIGRQPNRSCCQNSNGWDPVVPSHRLGVVEGFPSGLVSQRRSADNDRDDQCDKRHGGWPPFLLQPLGKEYSLNPC